MTANDNFGSQVQEIGLQVLRNLIQKGTNVEDDTFLMLFVGELASDFFLIMQNMLKVFPFGYILHLQITPFFLLAFDICVSERVALCF